MSAFKIGRYEILDEIGRGGMATVYQAFDPQFKRKVAIKVLDPILQRDPLSYQRFVREAQIIANLEHQSIVPVYDFGQDSGMLYLVMRLMNGGSLAERLKQGPLSLPEAIRVFQRLAPGLDIAHKKGIVHRDLKPANILFDEWNEPYLSDFGIVKLLEGNGTTLTPTGRLIGTPAYMSPEQAKGDQDVDSRTDIYALGTILYEVLTGHTPYEADTPVQVLMKHILDPVPQIRTLQPDLPERVEDIVSRALAKETSSRFQTASEMVDALKYVADSSDASVIHPLQTELTPGDSKETVAVRSADGELEKGPVEHYAKPHSAILPKMNRLPRWLLILFVILALGLGAVGLASIIQPGVDQNATLEVPTQTSTSNIGLPAASLAPTSAADSVAVTVQAASPTPLATAASTPAATVPPTETPFGGGMGKIAFVSDRAGEMDLYVLDLTTNQTTQLTASNGDDWDPAVSPDGSAITFVTNINGNSDIYIIDLVTNEIQNITNHPAFDGDPAWSPDGNRLAFMSNRDGNREIYVLDLGTNIVRRMTNNQFEDWDPSWSEDGQYLVFGSGQFYLNGKICVAQLNGYELFCLTDSTTDGSPVWSPDGKQIAFQSIREGNWEIYLMNADGSELKNLSNHPARDRFPAWSADGRHLLFTSDRDRDREIYLMDLDSLAVTRITRNPGWDWDPTWFRP